MIPEIDISKEVDEEIVRKKLRDFLSVELGLRSIEAILTDILLKPEELKQRALGSDELRKYYEWRFNKKEK